MKMAASGKNLVGQRARSLFTYIIPVDDGAAPNPFGGVCTLAICKPSIRRVAEVGDWVVGLGSKRAQPKSLEGHVVYAMRVTGKMTLSEYDAFAREKLPDKIPDMGSTNNSRRVGDCIYDYSRGRSNPVQRRGVHNQQNMRTDLGGAFVLLSRDFYYFGDAAVRLPEGLRSIVKQQQGHRRITNRRLITKFESWLRRHGKTGVRGKPGYRKSQYHTGSSSACAGGFLRTMRSNHCS